MPGVFPGAGVTAVVVILCTLAGTCGFRMPTISAVVLLMYLDIAVSQLRMRARAEREGRALELKMWLFPWLTWLVIGTIVMVLGYMLFSDAYRYETLMTAGVTLFVLLVSLTQRRHDQSVARTA